MADKPANVAEAVLHNHGIHNDAWVRTIAQVRPLLAEAIELDRQQILDDVADSRPFHADGELCIVAIVTANCPQNHLYGRTFEGAH
jgi:hypothetical protein